MISRREILEFIGGAEGGMFGVDDGGLSLITEVPGEELEIGGHTPECSACMEDIDDGREAAVACPRCRRWFCPACHEGHACSSPAATGLERMEV